MSIWYLSFADPSRPKGSQFLGGALVRADSFDEAFTSVRRINPGGEIAAWDLTDDGDIDDRWMGRLLSLSDLQEQAHEMTGDDTILTTADPAIADSVDVFVCQDHNRCRFSWVAI